MRISKETARRAAFAVAITILVAACSSKGGTQAGGHTGVSAGASMPTNNAAGYGLLKPGPHARDEVTLADMAYDRLGGAQAPSPVEVVSASVVGTYGLAVVKIGSSMSETLFERENGAWKALASNPYQPGGRGLLRFGISVDLARRLDSALGPVSQQ